MKAQRIHMIQIASNVYQATKLTDMRERDVISTLDITSQSFVFDYMNGIRECYIGTDKDPWKYIR